MVRHLILLLALLAACATPPSFEGDSVRDELRAPSADVTPNGVVAEDSGDRPTLEDPAAGTTPSWWQVPRWVRGHQLEPSLHAPVEHHSPVRVAWDQRDPIRRMRPSMTIGRGRPDLVSS